MFSHHYHQTALPSLKPSVLNGKFSMMKGERKKLSVRTQEMWLSLMDTKRVRQRFGAFALLDG
jgi:hypothetical protein